MPIWGQVELLCRAISEEGRKEADRILSQAHEEAQRALNQALQIAEQDAAEEIHRRRSAAHAEAKRIVDSAEMEARKRIIASREEIVREVFDALGKRLEAFATDPSYGNFLVAALSEGVERLSGSAFLAEMSARDLELVGKRIQEWAEDKGFTIELGSSPSIGGGVRVYGSDGRKLYDNSLAARLKRNDTDIRQEIWRSIFGAERKPD